MGDSTFGFLIGMALGIGSLLVMAMVYEGGEERVENLVEKGHVIYIKDKPYRCKAGEE